MKNNKGITLVNMVVIVLAMIIIAGVTVLNGTDIINKTKLSKQDENLANVKIVVSTINSKLVTAGVLTPANITLYGTSAITPSNDVASWITISVPANLDKAKLSEWYLVTPSDAEQMNIQDLEENYIVNYKANIVYRQTTDAISQIVNDSH